MAIIMSLAGPSECEDRLAGCDVWFDDGFCENSTDLMSVFCRKTCGFCSTRPEVCLDVISFCPQWANSGLCIASQEFMLANCPKSCDFCKAS
ncbi:hypothetical protein DAPPUDRAFT_263203 [Daphnia pulex]|uniref:ShKT domain-containing protein n=1 Tax=Daphnia pulex TaxID=6669 RepID=E9HPB7_DAPPU|nr:hypothetical protein DAPPUDRAFT_263203 [Daphnia pulex]|eukprot:EFX66417.1 hypothetical protein DAPPUDRAFT_263203 [Daphnia pulex]